MAARKKHPVTGTMVSQAEYDRAMKTLEAGQRQAEIDAERTRAEAKKYLGDDGDDDDDEQTEWDRIRAETERKAIEALGRPTMLQPWPDRDGSPAPRSNALIGCAVAVLLVAVLVLCGAVVWLSIRTQQPNNPQPTPAPVVVPAVNLDSLVAPIKAKLAYDPEKAKTVYRLYGGFSEALAGKSGERVTNTRVLRDVTAALLSDAGAKGGTAVGREIDEAIAAHVGIKWGTDSDGGTGWEFKAFTPGDRVKLAEITQAIAKAAKESL